MADATGPQCLSDWNHTEADYGQQLVMCSSEIYLSTGCPKKMLHSDLVLIAASAALLCFYDQLFNSNVNINKTGVFGKS